MDHFILNWLPYIERSMPVFLYYLCVGAALMLLGVRDLTDHPQWLAMISVIAGVLCLSMAFFRQIRYRAVATTLISFAMLGRLADYWVELSARPDPLSLTQSSAFFLTFVWVSLLLGLVALVTTDADLPAPSQRGSDDWAIFDLEPGAEAEEPDLNPGENGPT